MAKTAALGATIRQGLGERASESAHHAAGRAAAGREATEERPAQAHRRSGAKAPTVERSERQATAQDALRPAAATSRKPAPGGTKKRRELGICTAPPARGDSRAPASASGTRPRWRQGAAAAEAPQLGPHPAGDSRQHRRSGQRQRRRASHRHRHAKDRPSGTTKPPDGHRKAHPARPSRSKRGRRRSTAETGDDDRTGKRPTRRPDTPAASTGRQRRTDQRAPPRSGQRRRRTTRNHKRPRRNQRKSHDAPPQSQTGDQREPPTPPPQERRKARRERATGTGGNPTHPPSARAGGGERTGHGPRVALQGRGGRMDAPDRQARAGQPAPPCGDTWARAQAPQRPPACAGENPRTCAHKRQGCQGRDAAKPCRDS